MRILDCKQGSPEWLESRLGIPTASNFDKVLTPKTRTPSASIPKYVAKLTAEWFLGVPLDEAESGFMQRGTDMESKAVRYYEFERNVDVQPVGLCLRDDGRVGASPDGLVGDEGGLEIKCLSAEKHMGILLGHDTDDYLCQVQGGLYVTGRKWWDLLAYHPVFPSLIVRFERDEEFMAAFGPALAGLLARLDEAKARFKDEKETYDSIRAAGHTAGVSADFYDFIGQEAA